MSYVNGRGLLNALIYSGADCLPLCDLTVGRCWEADENSLQSCSKQILDVQGRLRAASKF